LIEVQTLNHGHLYLAMNSIEHTKTRAPTPQTKGICERFHKTILQEFYQVTFRKKIYGDIETLQMDLDEWLHYYNMENKPSRKSLYSKLYLTMTDIKIGNCHIKSESLHLN